MNMKNKICMCKVTGLILVLCLVFTGCGANEDALFVVNDGAEEAVSFKESDFSKNAATEETAVQTAEIAEQIVQTDEVSDAQRECIVVHVCGAVQTPGVYELEPGSRVMDAVVSAGGFSIEADSEYVNLATVLEDGSKVRIPTKEETTEMSLLAGNENDNTVTISNDQQNMGNTALQKVNINTADKDLLCTLPGIGETRAESILAYRKEHGFFSKIEDIMLVSGIKENSFQKIKEYITIK